MKKLLTLIFLLTALFSQLQAKDVIVQRYAWDGKLGKDIHFRLEIERNSEGLVLGETSYFRKNGQITDIPVFGTYSKDDQGNEILYLNEFDGNTQCGSFYIRVSGEWVKEGHWSLGEKILEFNDLENVGFSYGKNGTFFYPAEGEAVNGYYSFTYPNDNPDMQMRGGHAELTVKGSKVQWEMAQVTPNIAEGQGQSTLVGNKFSGNVGSFLFSAWVYQNCVYVKCLNPDAEPNEDFGAWATLEGIYVRGGQSTEPSEEPEHFVPTSDDGMMYWTATDLFTEKDRETLSVGFRESAAEFLREQFNDGSAEYKNALKLVTAPTLPITTEDLLQYTRVRSIQFGVNGFNAYQYFKCRFFPEVKMWHFVKDAGSQRKRGEVYRINDLAMAFTGCWYIGGDEPTFFNDPEHLITGLLVKIAPDKMVMLFQKNDPDSFGYELYEFAK